MPNPYKYTKNELDALLEEWNSDETIEWDLKDYIIYHTKFTDYEFETWYRERRVPTPKSVY